jgi:nucleoside-diphosphate-sugar epimerase
MTADKSQSRIAGRSSWSAVRIASASDRADGRCTARPRARPAPREPCAVRSQRKLCSAPGRLRLSQVETVFHLAAQVAVTTSLADPRDDFAVNAAGTLNLRELIREAGRRIALVFTSTNKVYGALDDVPLVHSQRATVRQPHYAASTRPVPSAP